MSKQPQKVQLLIQTLSKEGFGLGVIPCEPSHSRPQREWLEVEVPFTLPGDKVLVSPRRRRRGLMMAHLEEILVPSEARTSALCKHFGVCGGCRWQHLPYSMQQQWKEEHVRKFFAELIMAETEVSPILPCQSPWRYRNKMEFSFSSDSKGERYLGLVMQRGRHVFHLTECHLVESWMAEMVGLVRRWWSDFGLEAYHPSKNTGSLRTLTLRQGMRTGDRMVILTVSGNPDYALRSDALDAFKDLVRGSTTEVLSTFLRIQQIAKGRPTQFYEMHLDGPDTIREKLQIEYPSVNHTRALTFKISPSAFFQPNTLQAEKLYARALQILRPSADQTLYDLCCGAGTIGISAAPFVKRVIGIELSPEAVLDARANALENGCQNVEIHAGDVGQILSHLKDSGSVFPADSMIVDPPRVGLGSNAIQQILRFMPKKILYISCNPRSQAADGKQFCAAGYKLTALAPVDQFPQTIHIENIALFERPE